MAIDPLNITAETAGQLVTEVARIGVWLQAIGIFALIWILVQAYHVIKTRARIESLKEIKDDLRRIENKINKLKK